MFISWGDSVNQVTLYPPIIIELQNVLWFDDKASDREIWQPIFFIDQVMSLKESSEENQINTFLYNAYSTSKSNLSSLLINKIVNVEI